MLKAGGTLHFNISYIRNCYYNQTRNMPIYYFTFILTLVIKKTPISVIKKKFCFRHGNGIRVVISSVTLPFSLSIKYSI